MLKTSAKTQTPESSCSTEQSLMCNGWASHVQMTQLLGRVSMEAELLSSCCLTARACDQPSWFLV